MKVSLISNVIVEPERVVCFWLDSDISSEINYSDVMFLSSASTARRRYRPSRFDIFSASGRAEVGDGDLLEQVRAGHDG